MDIVKSKYFLPVIIGIILISISFAVAVEYDNPTIPKIVRETIVGGTGANASYSNYSNYSTFADKWITIEGIMDDVSDILLSMLGLPTSAIDFNHQDIDNVNNLDVEGNITFTGTLTGNINHSLQDAYDNGNSIIGNPFITGNLNVSKNITTSSVKVLSYDDSVASALSIRQQNAPTYGFDFKLDQLVNGNMYLKRVVDSVESTLLSFTRSTGRLGIGTDSPNDLLEIYNAVGAASFRVARGSNSYAAFASWVPAGAASSSNVHWGMGMLANENTWKIWSYDGSTTSYRLAIQNDGKIGIGTQTPTYPLEVVGNVSGISIWSDGNISASGYLTRTSVYDKSKGNALSFIQDSDYYLKLNGKINHTKFYGYSGETLVTDYSRPEIEEYIDEQCDKVVVGYNNVIEESCSIIKSKIVCLNVSRQIQKTNEINCKKVIKERIVYPYTISQEQVSLDKEIDVLRQAIYELKQENNLIKVELCKLNKNYSFCYEK